MTCSTCWFASEPGDTHCGECSCCPESARIAARARKRTRLLMVKVHDLTQSHTWNPTDDDDGGTAVNLRGVMTPATVGVMTQQPADEAYTALSLRLVALQKEAGAFLATSLRPDATKPQVSRRMAEDFAREANEVSDQMKAWRLAHGYEK